MVSQFSPEVTVEAADVDEEEEEDEDEDDDDDAEAKVLEAMLLVEDNSTDETEPVKAVLPVAAELLEGEALTLEAEYDADSVREFRAVTEVLREAVELVTKDSEVAVNSTTPLVETGAEPVEVVEGLGDVVEIEVELIEV